MHAKKAAVDAHVCQGFPAASAAAILLTDSCASASASSSSVMLASVVSYSTAWISTGEGRRQAGRQVGKEIQKRIDSDICGEKKQLQ